MIDPRDARRGGGCSICLIALVVCLSVVSYMYLDAIRPSAAHIRKTYGPAAFVAGASEGLGAAWTEFLAASGINLVICARHAEALEAQAARLRLAYGVEVVTKRLDLADGEALVPYADQLFRNRSDIRLVVYNAAYTGYHAGFFALDSLAMAHQAIDVNVNGVLSLVHPFLRERQQRGDGGGVVLMSSMAGLVGSAHLSVYAATKAWNTAFATGLYDELRPLRVDVLSCIAGATTTPSYLEDARAGRATLIEQSPRAVVDECAAALGHSPTRATGLLNRFAQVLMTRLLPTSTAVGILSQGARDTTKFERVGPRGEVVDPSW